MPVVENCRRAAEAEVRRRNRARKRSFSPKRGRTCSQRATARQEISHGGSSARQDRNRHGLRFRHRPGYGEEFAKEGATWW